MQKYFTEKPVYRNLGQMSYRLVQQTGGGILALSVF